MNKPTILSVALIFFFSFHLEAQLERKEIVLKDIPLSPEDKRTLIALLKGADSRYYRFELNSGREVYGTRKITATETRRLKALGAPDTRGLIVDFKETKSIIVNYKDGTILAATSPTGKTDQDVFVNLLGKQGADKLRDILSKYFIHDVDG